MFKEKVVGLLWERRSHHLGRFWGPFWKHSLFLIGLSAAISCWDLFWSLFSAKWGLLLGSKSDTGPSLGRRCPTYSGHPGRKACLPLRERRLFLLQKFPGAGSGLGRVLQVVGESCVFIYDLAISICGFSLLLRVACCPQGLVLSRALRTRPRCFSGPVWTHSSPCTHLFPTGFG